ncbi:MAG: lipopolysaccharide heptosyltransferase II [Leptospira sp.]|nr:lipopolysaccharide heptosyltransferase II [Leptospira sp.]
MTQKILILQTAFLGDLILSTPFFHAVRNQFPDAQIDLVCNLGTEQIVFGNPDISEVIPIDKKKSHKRLFGFLKFALALRDKNYDIIFSPHFSYRSTILSYIIGAKIRIGYKQSGFSFLHTKKILRPVIGPHEVHKLFSLLYDSENDFPKGRDQRPFLYPGEVEITNFNHKASELKILPKSYIIIAPSSLWETKRMPEEKFVSVMSHILRKRSETIVLVGSKSDTAIEEKIFGLLKTEPLKPKERIRVHSLIGKTSLGDLAVWIQNSSAIITNDSSPVHYASAFDIPTVMIYGATIPGFGYSSLSTKHKLIEIENLNCRPCGIHGGKICPKSHFKCMLDQDPLKIFKALEEVIN